MKTYLIGIVFLLLSTVSQAALKEDSSGLKLYNYGLECYNNGKLDSAVIVWTDLVDKKIGVHYDTYGSAFFNIPTVYWQLNKYDKAKEWYKKILTSDLRDSDETGSLMEPHTNYKHKSAIALAGLYQIDSNDVQVLHWLNMADTVYQYWGFEGSATNISIEESYILNWKIRVLEKLNRKDEAIQQIVLKLIYSDNLDSYFDKSERKLFSFVKKDKFKSDFDKALSLLSVEMIDKTNYVAFMSLYGVVYKIHISKDAPDDLPHFWKKIYWTNSADLNAESVVKHIKGFDFYKRLSK